MEFKMETLRGRNKKMYVLFPFDSDFFFQAKDTREVFLIKY